jgi:hypothetical protein
MTVIMTPAPIDMYSTCEKYSQNTHKSPQFEIAFPDAAPANEHHEQVYAHPSLLSCHASQTKKKYIIAMPPQLSRALIKN